MLAFLGAPPFALQVVESYLGFTFTLYYSPNFRTRLLEIIKAFENVSLEASLF